ncbi:YcnI family copper-binding membrane protein [Tessaracoccus caeni]|uniref:YcnI family copper-binding membrane protein n=1 Tax=Tessaracoccus caeni TaxID=3031239 RepID=UPI0023DBB96A|nr:YcnI family protein [Tessaracoccus caeni]MDF1489837.1 YcnI family protein [Tessaracoccus caeni]
MNKMSFLRVAASSALGAVCLVAAGGSLAFAHVSAASSTNEPGSYALVTFSVPHACDGSPTTQVAIQIPEGINAVTPTRHALYDLEKVMETLEPPVADSHGNQVTERVAQVIYTAKTPLPDGQRDAFELSLELPEDGEQTLYFPTVQSCEQGESAWVEIPADGQDPHDLALPAPALELTAASSDGGHSHDHDEAAHSDHNAGPEASATGGGLTIAALVVGAAGLLTGIVALLRSRPRS